MVGIAAVVSLALAGCFPTPPPLPPAEPMPPAPQPTLPSQPAPPPSVSDPAEPAPTVGGGQAVVPGVFGELLAGTLAADEVAVIEVALGERAPTTGEAALHRPGRAAIARA